ncbi:MAG: hypothetical protein ACI4XR_04320 [Bacilli bacterium]
MFNIKEILKASVCSFCENIYEYNSIDEVEFIKSLKYFLHEEDLQDCLEVCTSEIAYDIDNIENVCDNLYLLKYKQFEERDIIDICKNAYLMTVEKNKTINVEAFVDNLARVFSNTKIP